MITADSIGFTTPIDFLEDMEQNKFSVFETSHPNRLVERKYFLKQKPFGVNEITINERRGTVYLKISSKILLEDYKQGISLNTLEHFVDRINNCGINLNKDFVFETKVTSVDIKNDITIDGDINQVLNSFNHLGANKFVKTTYNTGIVFKEKVSTFPCRLTMYGKEYEIRQGEKFYKAFPSFIEDFDNVLRVEGRLAKAGTIKKHIGSNDFMDVLGRSNINYHILNKIIDGQEFGKSYDIEKMTAAEERNFGRIYLLYDQFNGDLTKIIAHIKSKLGGNTKASPQIKETKLYFSMIEAANDNLIAQNIELVRNALLET